MNIHVGIVSLFLWVGCNGLSFAGEYEVIQTILMHDHMDPVGFQITGSLKVIYKGPDVYLFSVESPGLLVMSKKNSNQFHPHRSILDDSPNYPFIVSFGSGLVKEVQLSSNDTVSMRNLKRSLASLFQFDLKEGSRQEIDSSGKCTVSYSVSKEKLSKSKVDCDVPPVHKGIWGGDLKSNRLTEVSLSAEKDKIMSIHAVENHNLLANLADYSSIKLSADLKLKRIGEVSEEVMVYDDDVVLQILIEIGGKYKKSDLILEKEDDVCTSNKCPELSSVIGEVQSKLAKYGSRKSAASIYKVVEAMRRSNQEEIFAVLKKKEFKDVLPALLDAAGTAHNEEIHQAVLRRLRINTERYNLDHCERYLWALSLSQSPSVNITKDVIQLVKETHKDEKLQKTLVLTAAALVKKITLRDNNFEHEVAVDLVKHMTETLDGCEKSKESCRQLYLQGLSQMENPLTKDTFIKYSTNSSKKSGVLAIKGLYKLGPSHWDKQILATAIQVFLSQGFDSSAQVTALKIILESRPSPGLLRLITSQLLLPTSNKEINTLLLDKLTHLSEKCPHFAKMIKEVMKDLNHWNARAQGGLSTSFARYFMSDGFLSTDQEISSGVLKEGYVHVNLVHNKSENTVFTLGLFSSGLNSFVSSENTESSNEIENEDVSAGMQLEVLGVQLRPFIFFNGNGELMGHVWSGTASSETPAYQAALLIGSTDIEVPLGIGGTYFKLRLAVCTSLQLSGSIEISIWNRNAHSAVYNRAGLSVEGELSVSNSWVHSKVLSHLIGEPSLYLTSDIDFGSSTALCLMLQQPNSEIRYNTKKIEKIIGSKQQLKKSGFKTIPIPGRTYALNQKNNEMCNVIHH